MFQVLDNGKPADSNGYPSLKGRVWDNSIFQSFNEAQQYVKKWLGRCFLSCVPQRPDQKIDYNEDGDTIEIKSL